MTHNSEVLMRILDFLHLIIKINAFFQAFISVCFDTINLIILYDIVVVLPQRSHIITPSNDCKAHLYYSFYFVGSLLLIKENKRRYSRKKPNK